MTRALLLLVVLAFLCLSQPTSVQSQGCAFCPVAVCTGVLPNISSVSLQVPDTALGTGQQFCQALNADLNFWIATAPSQLCTLQVTAFACQVMLSVNATETNCNVSSIGSGVSNFSQQFTLGCQAETSCLSTLIGSELVQFHACDNFTAFLGALPVMAALIPQAGPVSSTGARPSPNGAESTWTVSAVLWCAVVGTVLGSMMEMVL